MNSKSRMDESRCVVNITLTQQQQWHQSMKPSHQSMCNRLMEPMYSLYKETRAERGGLAVTLLLSSSSRDFSTPRSRLEIPLSQRRESLQLFSIAACCYSLAKHVRAVPRVQTPRRCAREQRSNWWTRILLLLLLLLGLNGRFYKSFVYEKRSKRGRKQKTPRKSLPRSDFKSQQQDSNRLYAQLFFFPTMYVPRRQK